MGRKLLAAGAVTAASLAMSAAPALAHSKMHTFSNGHGKLTGKTYRKFEKNFVKKISRLRSSARTSSFPGLSIVRENFKAECTVPTPSVVGGFTNIYSHDTVIYSLFGVLATGNCTADLSKPQTIVRANGSTYTGMVPYSTSATQNYSEECADAAAIFPSVLLGAANSTTWKDGEFVETCEASII
jgi:hypothetical protein